MTGIALLLPCPVGVVVVALCAGRARTLTWAASLVMWLQVGVATAVCAPRMLAASPALVVGGAFRADAIACVFVVLNTLVVAAALTHGIGFVEREGKSEHPPSIRALRGFYVFAALFLVSMYAVVLADNLGFLWIAIEATTVVSAPLVYFHRSRTALEATWKYLIICSVGIAFAFLGTAILFAGTQRVPQLGAGSLSLTVLSEHARLLPRGLVRLAFVFALLGYGTKAGLFPLHAWLPDAHSEAPAPASAMLSGALLNCALVALWRLCELMTRAGDSAFVHATLLPMSVATVIAAGLLMLRQRDLKRLLAYSSMENVGVMGTAIALGTGTGLALQAVNHSLVKVALFLLAGNLLQRYGTKTIADLHGVLVDRPVQGLLLLLGAIAVAGTPPFGSFLAEWRVLSVAADGHHYATAVALTVGLAIGFIALMIQVGGIVFGAPVPASDATGKVRGAPVVAIPAALMCASLVLGVALPAGAMTLIQRLVP